MRFDWGGALVADGKIVQNAVFHGKRDDNRNLKLQLLLSRNYVAIAQASGKKNTYKYKSFWPVTVGVSRSGVHASKIDMLSSDPRNTNLFVRVPDREGR